MSRSRVQMQMHVCVYTHSLFPLSLSHTRSVRAHTCGSDHDTIGRVLHTQATQPHTNHTNKSLPLSPPFLTRAPSHLPRPSFLSPALPPPPLLYTPPPQLRVNGQLPCPATLLPRLVPPASNIFPPPPAPSPSPASSCPYSLLLLIHSRSRRRTLISWIPPPPWPRPVREGGRETERGRRERRERRAYTEHLH